MKRIVIYSSKYGTVQRYAEGIARSLDAEVLPVKKAEKIDLHSYTSIIYGGSVYSGKISGLADFLPRALRTKAYLYIFAVGIAPATSERIEKLRSKTKLGKLPFFYFRGAFDYKKLTMEDKLWMRLLRMMLKQNIHPGANDDWAHEVTAHLTRPVDYTDLRDAKFLVDAVLKNEQ